MDLQIEGGERRFQLVRRDRQELVTNADGLSELGRSFLDAALEVGVQITDRLLREQAVGHVARDLREAPVLPFPVVERRQRDVGPKARTVSPQAPAFTAPRTITQCSVECMLRLAGRCVIWREEDREVTAENLLRRVPFDALRAGIPAGYVTLRVQQKDGIVADAVNEQPEPLGGVVARLRGRGVLPNHCFALYIPTIRFRKFHTLSH